MILKINRFKPENEKYDIQEGYSVNLNQVHTIRLGNRGVTLYFSNGNREIQTPSKEKTNELYEAIIRNMSENVTVLEYSLEIEQKSTSLL